MKILGIETSCDETAAAVVLNGEKILSNVVASSAETHAGTGGIIPENAARQQVKSILPVIEGAITCAKCRMAEIDAVAVTSGPGLMGSLLVGVEAAKVLAYLYKKPLIPINHLLAHIYANWLNRPAPVFPLLALVVSGGHTDLVYIKRHGHIRWVGGTKDDAAGEAFDKTARLLGLPYPGGPALALEASKVQSQSEPSLTDNELQMFPRPMIDEDNFDFSFSGLKTAVLREVQNPDSKIPRERLAAEIQEAIVDVLVKKTLNAVKKFSPKSLLLAGGVSANSRLRQVFMQRIENSKLKIEFRVPEPNLCTDNAAYVAACAYYNYHPAPWWNIKTNPELSIAGQV